MTSISHGNSHLSRLSQLSTTATTRNKNRKPSIDHTLLRSPNDEITSVARTDDHHSLAHASNAIVYGIINAILAIPAIYGYTVIIFSHRDFQEFMLALSKLVVYSSVVHQIMFTLTSSMPFSIGQVQDGGLIFLSTMASSICNSLGDEVPLEAKVATSVVTIAIATALFGICLVAMGKMKLAALASYLPMPVIGGYLAFIGIFCLYAGIALCTGLVVDDVKSMITVFSHAQDILLCVPGVLGGAFLLVVSQRYDNSFILSGAIMIMPLTFFFIMLVGGISMDDARDGGWIDPAKDPATITDLVNLFDFSQVYWAQLPKQFGTWIGMVFIVAFGSCLDIAAIELDMGRKLDFNHELKTVGWSNVVSGLLGGYTGSYIFSQTIFTYRSKTNSRIVATLIFIAIDLMIEWLLLTVNKMSWQEYAVLWMTFVAVNVVSLDVGIAIGVGFAIINFLFGYIRLTVVNRIHRSSGAALTFDERKILNQKRGSIAYFELSSFLFFGSSAQILDVVQKAVYAHKKRDVGVDDAGAYNLGDESILLTPDERRTPLIECLDGTPTTNSNAVLTEYVVMDFTDVTVMDVTATRSAFLILQRYCSNHNITVVYGGAIPEVCNMLVKNNITDEDSLFSSAESALVFCEKQILCCPKRLNANQVHSSSYQDEYATFLLHNFIGEPDDSEFSGIVDQFFRKFDVSAGYEFYSAEEYVDCFYFLASGCVTLTHKTVNSHVATVLPGSLFSEVEFFTHQQQLVRATAMEQCTVFEMNRETYEMVQQHAPSLCSRIRYIVVQSMATALTLQPHFPTSSPQSDFFRHLHGRRMDITTSLRCFCRLRFGNAR